MGRFVEEEVFVERVVEIIVWRCLGFEFDCYVRGVSRVFCLG